MASCVLCHSHSEKRQPHCEVWSKKIRWVHHKMYMHNEITRQKGGKGLLLSVCSAHAQTHVMSKLTYFSFEFHPCQAGICHVLLCSAYLAAKTIDQYLEREMVMLRQANILFIFSFNCSVGF